jgi:hypothetical protein
VRDLDRSVLDLGTRAVMLQHGAVVFGQGAVMLQHRAVVLVTGRCGVEGEGWRTSNVEGERKRIEPRRDAKGRD